MVPNMIWTQRRQESWNDLEQTHQDIRYTCLPTLYVFFDQVHTFSERLSVEDLASMICALRDVCQNMTFVYFSVYSLLSALTPKSTA